MRVLRDGIWYELSESEEEDFNIERHREEMDLASIASSLEKEKEAEALALEESSERARAKRFIYKFCDRSWIEYSYKAKDELFIYTVTRGKPSYKKVRGDACRPWKLVMAAMDELRGEISCLRASVQVMESARSKELK